MTGSFYITYGACGGSLGNRVIIITSSLENCPLDLVLQSSGSMYLNVRTNNGLMRHTDGGATCTPQNAT